MVQPMNVDFDLLADAMFPLVDSEPEAESESAPSSPETPSPAVEEERVHDNEYVHVAFDARDPHSQLLLRVKQGLEPQIEPCVPVLLPDPPMHRQIGWHSLVYGEQVPHASQRTAPILCLAFAALQAQATATSAAGGLASALVGLYEGPRIQQESDTFYLV